VKHGALLDAELLTQLYIELTGGRQIGLGLTEEASRPDQLASMRRISQPAERKTCIPAREHHADADELARHRIFIEGIENPLWTEI
jgi:DNA polymerase-3 subunit epsilon